MLSDSTHESSASMLSLHSKLCSIHHATSGKVVAQDHTGPCHQSARVQDKVVPLVVPAVSAGEHVS